MRYDVNRNNATNKKQTLKREETFSLRNWRNRFIALRAAERINQSRRIKVMSTEMFFEFSETSKYKINLKEENSNLSKA